MAIIRATLVYVFIALYILIMSPIGTAWTLLFPDTTLIFYLVGLFTSRLSGGNSQPRRTFEAIQEGGFCHGLAGGCPDSAGNDSQHSHGPTPWRVRHPPRSGGSLLS